tara:strand:- start:448 stop:1077 length:630 start_codon:yes stop_codon:yes gene_type:complete
MHKINVLTFGSQNFNTSLEELKEFFNFNVSFSSDNIEKQSFQEYDVILIHEDFINKNSFQKSFLIKIKKIKILLSYSNLDLPDYFDTQLSLPTNIKDLNEIVENSIAKKSFTKNSSIIIKGYNLDKNEKRLTKGNVSIFLTEKEIQLLELLNNNSIAIQKDKILKEVWKYADDVDTHTVETHIYRLRKKIKDQFSDNNFILNKKEGYLI